MRWYNKLSFWIPVFILLATVVPLLIYGVVSLRMNMAAFTQEAGRANRETVALVRNEIESSINSMQQNLVTASGNPAFSKAEYGVQYQSLQTLLETFPDIKVVSVIDTDGNERAKASLERIFLPEDLANRADDPIFEQAMSGQNSIGPVEIIPLHVPAVTLAVPIWDAAHQKTVGALTAQMSLRRLLDEIVSREVGETGYVFVVNREGRLIAHPDYSLAMAEADFSDHPYVRLFLDGQYLDKAHTLTTQNGARVLTVGDIVPDLDWIIVVEQPLREALALAHSLEEILIGALILVAVLSGGLATFLVFYLLRPLRDLQAGAERIGQGSLNERIQISSRDEVGQLAHAFNRMAENLRSSQEKVADRQRLLLALSHAGAAIQRAKTSDQVFESIAGSLNDLGDHALFFNVIEDRSRLRLAHTTLPLDMIEQAEQTSGMSASDIEIDLSRESLARQAFIEGRSIFCPDVSRSVTQTLPEPVRPAAARILAELSLQQSILVPLTVGEEPVGLLEVVGDGLNEADIPAMSAFANQVSAALENARLYARLHKYSQELEGRVEERTKDLNQARLAALNMMEDADEARQRAERAEEGLRLKAQDLERSNKELGQFAYVASHDLQEPLRAISGYLQLLERRYVDQIDAEAATFITRAVDAAARMKELIEALLSYSRVGTRGSPFQPADVGRTVEQALVNLSVAIEKTGAVVTQDPMPVIAVDAAQMVQLFQNLVANAIKFRNDRVPHIHIGATPCNEKGEWTFWVQDNGIGIEPRFRERIFKVFERLHTRDEYPGTGIGLAICQKIVERHGGRIWVESEPCVGATFYFTVLDGAGIETK